MPQHRRCRSLPQISCRPVRSRRRSGQHHLREPTVQVSERHTKTLRLLRRTQRIAQPRSAPWTTVDCPMRSERLESHSAQDPPEPKRPPALAGRCRLAVWSKVRSRTVRHTMTSACRVGSRKTRSKSSESLSPGRGAGSTGRGRRSTARRRSRLREPLATDCTM